MKRLIAAIKTKPSAEELGAPSAKKSKRGKRDDYEKKFIQSKSTVLTGDVEAATEGLYKPKTPETKQTYEVLLSFIQVRNLSAKFIFSRYKTTIRQHFEGLLGLT